MKRVDTPGIGLLIGLLLVTGMTAAQAAPAEHCRPMLAAIGQPEVNGRDDTRLLCRDGYVLSHDNERKVPNWVVEHLTPNRFTGPGDREKLGNPFAPDPDLPPDKRAEKIDYAQALPDGRRFDRGHMAPAAAMKYSEVATVESFYLSNMAPQQGVGLNRHIWADLEELTRDWTCERGDLYVITGPIYDNEKETLLGPDAVAVPTAFFKIAYDPKTLRAIAFILPNEKVDKHGKTAWEALQAYIVSLRDVESRAGLRLMRGLALREQKRLSTLKSVMWPLRDRCGAVTP